jgi:hypothetical protein
MNSTALSTHEMSLRREMVALGVPRGQTAGLAAFVGLESPEDLRQFLEDLDGMYFMHVMGVPEALRASFINLHNAVCLPDNVWAPPPGLEW